MSIELRNLVNELFLTKHDKIEIIHKSIEQLVDNYELVLVNFWIIDKILIIFSAQKQWQYSPQSLPK